MEQSSKIADSMNFFKRVILLLLIISLSPMIMIATTYFLTIGSAVKETTLNEIKNLTAQIASEIERTVNDAYIKIIQVSQNPILNPGNVTDEKLRRELIHTTKMHNIFRDLTVIDSNAVVRASATNSFRGTWISTQWYKDAMNGEIVLSDIHAVLYPFDIVMTAAAPIKNEDGSIGAVIVGVLNTEKIWTILEEARIPKRRELFLINRNGIVLDSPDSEETLEPLKYRIIYDEILKGRNETLEFPDNSRRKTAILTQVDKEESPVKLGWTLALIQPSIAVFYLITKSRLIFLTIFLFTICGISYISVKVSHHYSRKINKLLDATKEIGRENFTFRLTDLGSDEFGELAKSINSTTVKLEAAKINRANAERKLRNLNRTLYTSKQRYELAARGANDAIWDWDLTENKIYFSDRWWEILGKREDGEFHTPESWFSQIHHDDLETVKSALDDHFLQKTPFFDVEYRIRNHLGDYRWIHSRGNAIQENEKPYRIAGSHTDITSRKQLLEKIAFSAYYDSLTGLPNRSNFLERLDQALQRASRIEEYSFSILFLDYDGFKHVNDTYGHAAGDLLLISIAQRLKLSVRTIDVISRIGGDEFLILLDGISDKSVIEEITERILKESEREFIIDGQSVFISVSIGITSEKEGTSSADDLIRDSDIAMYQAKMNGKGQWYFFTETLKTREIKRWSMEHALHKALEAEDLEIYYQPIFTTGDAPRLYGFEALLRWNHSSEGIIPPGEFIPAAEESGFITQITEWLIRRVCRQVLAWNERISNDENHIIMSMNVTAKDFLIAGGLDNLIKRVLDETECNPSWLSIEVTEGVMIKNFETVNQQLNKIKKMGLSIKLDDFGTGFSSLSYLNKFKIDYIKIDKSFIRAMSENDSSMKLVKSIINMAHDINLKVIAEGVEEEDDLASLKNWGCDYIQGYIYSKPIDPSNAEKFISFTL